MCGSAQGRTYTGVSDATHLRSSRVAPLELRTPVLAASGIHPLGRLQHQPLDLDQSRKASGDGSQRGEAAVVGVQVLTINDGDDGVDLAHRTRQPHARLLSIDDVSCTHNS